MTSIVDNILRRRVLVDWDGDSFLNTGVLQSAPRNLFPSQLYATGSFLRGEAAGSISGSQTGDNPETNMNGLVYRQVHLGTPSTGARLMWDDYLSFQPHVGDTPNLIPGAADFDTLTWEYITADQNGLDQSLPQNVYLDNGRVGFKVGGLGLGIGAGGNNYTFGLSATNGGVAHKPLSTTGFFDAGNRYSQVLNNTSTAVKWGGFPPIVAGQQYTFICYFMFPSVSVFSGATSQTIKPRLYADGGSASTPNFGRQDLGGSDLVLNVDTWVQMKVTFTAPAGATAMALDVQTASGNGFNTLIGGMMLLAGNQNPTRFWDNRISFVETQFSFPAPGDSQDYLLSYWVRSLNGVDTFTPTRHVADIGTNTITDTVLSVVNVTTDWQRVDMLIPASATKRGVWVTLTATVGGFTPGVLHQGNLDFTGFMIVQGSNAYPYHAGDLYGYDDISDYILSISTKNGKTNFNDAIPSEGMATLLLRNDDRRFSPTNEDSPLFGYLEQNLKVKIQIWDLDNEEWVDIWSGWTYLFDVTPGTNRDNQAELQCQQGVYRFAEGTMAVPVQENISAVDLAQDVIENSGWRSTSTALQSFVGLHTLVGQNAYTQDVDLLYDKVEPGINTIELSGKDWSQSTDPRRALEDTLASENAMMWINRDGSISIVNRDHWVSSDINDEFRLDTEANQAEYDFGQELVNSVEVSITKNKAQLAQPVWETKRPVKLIPNQRWVIELKSEYTEGRVRTVIRYTTDGMTKTVYTKDTGINNDTTNAAAPQDQANKVKVELIGEAGNRPQLRITNNNGIPLWVSITLRGDYLETGDAEVIRVSNEDAIQEVQGTHTLTYSNPLITEPRQAASYGEFIMQRQSVPYGEFQSFRMTVRNTDDLARIINLSLGSIVRLSEIQSAEEAKDHVIIGEDFSIDNSKTLSVTWYVARTLQEKYYKTDISVDSDENVNEIPAVLLLQAASSNGGTFGTQNWDTEGLEDIMYWQTGAGAQNKLVLAPAREQLRVWHPLTGMYLMPLTDALGGAVTPLPVIRRFDDKYTVNLSGTAAFDANVHLLMPGGQVYLSHFVNAAVQIALAGGGSAQAFFGAKRSKTTDESVGAASWYLPTIPIIPSAKYIARAQFYIADYSIAHTTIGSSGLALYPLVKKPVGSGFAAQWTGTSQFTSNTLIAEVNEYMRHTDIAFRGTASGVGGEDVDKVGFQLYDNTGGVGSHQSLWQNESIINLSLLRYSHYGKYADFFLDTTISHKYTLFARTDVKSVAVSYTLTVIADDGTTIGTDAHTVATSGVTKFEVDIPSGNKAAWAYLSKTSEDYRDSKVLIYGYGITKNAVSSYLDLLVPVEQEKVYA